MRASVYDSVCKAPPLIVVVCKKIVWAEMDVKLVWSWLRQRKKSLSNRRAIQNEAAMEFRLEFFKEKILHFQKHEWKRWFWAGKIKFKPKFNLKLIHVLKLKRLSYFEAILSIFLWIWDKTVKCILGFGHFWAQYELPRFISILRVFRSSPWHRYTSVYHWCLPVIGIIHEIFKLRREKINFKCITQFNKSWDFFLFFKFFLCEQFCLQFE